MMKNNRLILIENFFWYERTIYAKV